MASLPRPAPSLTRLSPPLGSRFTGCRIVPPLGQVCFPLPPRAFRVSGALPAIMMLIAAFRSRSRPAESTPDGTGTGGTGTPEWGKKATPGYVKGPGRRHASRGLKTKGKKGGTGGRAPGYTRGPREPNPRIRGRPPERDARIRGLRKERGKGETGGRPTREGGEEPPDPRGGPAGNRTGTREPAPPDIRKGSREPPQGLDRDPIQQCKRRRATLPHPLKCSTIAVQGLSFRVRNGTGRLTLAMVAANLQPITTPAGGRRHVAVREPDNGREFVPWTKRMLPAEGTSRRTQYGQHQEQAWCVV